MFGFLHTIIKEGVLLTHLLDVNSDSDEGAQIAQQTSAYTDEVSSASESFLSVAV